MTNLHRKFDVPGFTPFKDKMGPKFINGSRDHHHACLGVVCHMWHRTCRQARIKVGVGLINQSISSNQTINNFQSDLSSNATARTTRPMDVTVKKCHVILSTHKMRHSNDWQSYVQIELQATSVANNSNTFHTHGDRHTQPFHFSTRPLKQSCNYRYQPLCSLELTHESFQTT